MRFDGKRGAGYGMPGGDERVHALQQALNRLGLTDGRGQPLAVDGKLGPAHHRGGQGGAEAARPEAGRRRDRLR
jgi:hypothetical protein